MVEEDTWEPRENLGNVEDLIRRKNTVKSGG